MTKPVERRASRVSHTTVVEHHYLNCDSVFDRFFDHPFIRKREAHLTVRGRNEMTPTGPCQRDDTSGYSGGFVAATAPDSGDRRLQFGVLRARQTPQQLRSIEQVDLLYSEEDLPKYYHVGEVLSHAFHIARRWREDANRSAEERDRALREFSRMEADPHSSQV